jgi:cation transport ATPase
MNGWENFLVAEVGASAALLGLLFVSVSINLRMILSHPPLPGRAFGALLMMLIVLITASLLLIPGQPMTLIGAEVTVVGLVAWAVNSRIDVTSFKNARPEYRRRAAGMIALNQVALILYVVCGVVILSAGKVGLYFLAAAVIVSFIKVMLDAWVLLVEINR